MPKLKDPVKTKALLRYSVSEKIRGSFVASVAALHAAHNDLFSLFRDIVSPENVSTSEPLTMPYRCTGRIRKEREFYLYLILTSSLSFFYPGTLTAAEEKNSSGYANIA